MIPEQRQLFIDNGANPTHNLLPKDGIVHHLGTFLSLAQADHYLQVFRDTLPWKHDEVRLYGKHIITARQVAWYGDRAWDYTYSGVTRQAALWTPELAAIKQEVEAASGERYNACLLNLYPSGNTGMAWHCDDEASLVREAAIASVSLGVTRLFSFKHKSDKTLATIDIPLSHGSLLVMRGETQRYWLHSLKKSLRIEGLRINLTFRKMLPLKR